MGLAPIAHLAHWASLLYALPVILLAGWAAWSWYSERKRRKS
jgi:hypothetical protein